MRFALILLLALFCFTSCRQSGKPHTQSAIAATDDLGHLVTLARAPARIVSLAPSITETLFALGLDSAVAGVTDYCDYPPAAKQKPRIGGMLNPNIEQVLALRPDLVLMSGSGNMRTDYEKITSSGVSAFVSYPKNVEDVLKSISVIGALTGRTGAADSIVRVLRQRKDELVRLARDQRRKSVLLLLSLNPLVAIGPGSFLDEMLSLANSDNMARGSTAAYPVLSREEILRAQPDVILAMSDVVRSANEILHAYPEWRDLTAIRQNQVAIVDAGVVSRPGPRIIDGLESLIRAIHRTR